MWLNGLPNNHGHGIRERERGLAWGCQAQHGLIHGTDSQDFNLSMYLAHSKLAWPLGTSPPLLFHK